MIKIEVKDVNKRRREVPRKSDNKILTFYEQDAWAHTYSDNGTQKPYPEAIQINLEAEQQPYAPGMYMVAPASVYVNKYRQLELGRLKLIPITAAAPAKVA